MRAFLSALVGVRAVTCKASCTGTRRRVPFETDHGYSCGVAAHAFTKPQRNVLHGLPARHPPLRAPARRIMLSILLLLLLLLLLLRLRHGFNNYTPLSSLLQAPAKRSSHAVAANGAVARHERAHQRGLTHAVGVVCRA